MRKLFTHEFAFPQTSTTCLFHKCTVKSSKIFTLSELFTSMLSDNCVNCSTDGAKELACKSRLLLKKPKQKTKSEAEAISYFTVMFMNLHKCKQLCKRSYVTMTH